MSKNRWLTAGDLLFIGLVMTIVGVVARVMDTFIMGSLPLIGLGVAILVRGVVRIFRP